MLVRLFVTFALVPIPAIIVSEAIAYAGLYLGPDQKASICKITRVIDGDTVAMRCSTPGSDRGRIRGIDTPELFSPQCASEAASAYKAKWALQLLLWSAGEIKVIISGTDRYDRRLITVFADGKDVAQSLVAAGHGRRYDGGQRTGWCG
jgi:micrococcal nuclease